MSCIHVLVGQCGNQLGSCIFNNLNEGLCGAEDASSREVSAMHFSNGAMPRVVRIDMESKVVLREQGDVTGRGVNKGSIHCVTKEEGSANNWAVGYLKQGPSRKEAITDALRQEVEAADAVSSFNIVHSLAGGTGSGVSCLVSEIMCEAHPRVPRIHSAVIPFSHGEVVTQWYNMLFSLSSLNESADAVHLLSNDDVCSNIALNAVSVGKQSKTLKTDGRNMSFDLINKEMTKITVPLFLPAVRLRVPLNMPPSKSCCSQDFSYPYNDTLSILRESAFGDAVVAPVYSSSALLESAALDPARKFVSAMCFPQHSLIFSDDFHTTDWHTTIAQMTRLNVNWWELMSPSIRTHYRGLMCLQGKDLLAEVGAIEALQQHISCDSSFNPNCLDIVALAGPNNSNNVSATLYAPCARIGDHIARACKQAELMISSNAYFHHFNRYGVENEHFQDALACCWQLANNYGYTLSDKSEED